jgi:hypothetical protein
MHEVLNLPAALAASAGTILEVPGHRAAIENTGDLECNRLFARTFRSGKEIGMSQSSGSECFFQYPDLMVMTDNGFPAHAFRFR